MGHGQTEFPLSMDEIDRRREAYTRLVLFVALGSLASSIDLLVSHPAIVATLLLFLYTLLFLSRAFFMRSFSRYSHTVWSLSDSRLIRDDKTSHDEYEFRNIDRVRVKRTVSDDIRAIAISFRDGRSLYVNALRTPQEFVDELVRNDSCVSSPTEVREPIDYDHPWFYRLLGLGIGVAITSIARIAANATASSATWIYLGVAAYMVGFGAYWLQRMPISQSYGEQRRMVDMAIGLCALCAGIGLGILVLVG